MTTFNEALHPRGNAGNPGQFRAKGNTTPRGGLDAEPAARVETLTAIADAYEANASAAMQSAYQWGQRTREAALHSFMANAALYAPEGATQAVFLPAEFEECPALSHFLDADGQELDADEFEMAGVDNTLSGVDDNDDIKGLGFVYDHERSAYVIDLFEPKMPSRAVAEEHTSVASQAHYVDAMADGDGGLGDFLAAIGRRNPQAAAALNNVTDQQSQALARDFESFASLVATKIAAPAPEENR